MAFTFDATNKLIILSTGTVSFSLADLWTAWKDWVYLGNAGAARALDYVGGEPINPAEGTVVSLYLFLLNDWKIRPYEGDHTLAVTGGTLIGPRGGDPFVSTLGDFTVRIRYEQPVQAIGYSTSGGSGPSAESIAAAVVTALQGTTIPANIKQVNDVTVQGAGTPANPMRPA